MRPLAEVQADAATIQESLLAIPSVVDEFCESAGISPSRFGYLSSGNPSMVVRLHGKSNVKLPTLHKVLRFMVNWRGNNA